MFTLDIIQFACIQNKSSHSPSCESLIVQLIMWIIVFSGVNQSIVHNQLQSFTPPRILPFQTQCVLQSLNQCIVLDTQKSIDTM